MLELMGRIGTITEEDEQKLRNLTDKELNTMDESAINDLILLDESEKRQRFQQLLGTVS